MAGNIFRILDIRFNENEKIHMGRFDLAETYYHQSLNTMLNRQGFQYDQENIAVFYNSLGNMNMKKASNGFKKYLTNINKYFLLLMILLLILIGRSERCTHE
jgi:hypothetical protein